MADKFYLTTPLYYVNSKPHIGHSYTQIAADVLARFHRLRGQEVFFLTGTDEHGQKVQKAADAQGLDPQQFTDRMVPMFKSLWQTLNISYDDFIRTTDLRHKKAVAKVWGVLSQNNEVVAKTYDGWYCTPCEAFNLDSLVLRENDQVLCPDCKRPVEKIKEDNYFFTLSKHQAWLISEIESDRIQIMPDIRKNEVLGFLKNTTLQDLCISRPKTRLSWGIPSPLGPDHVTYVWFDALINYISACGYGETSEDFDKNRWWPADIHLIGKDIIRHHAVIWPAILHALGIPAPKMVFAHGWWVQGGEKMSKSLGNVVDPVRVVEQYGVDPYRYFLLREVPFGWDGTFSEEALIDRFNHDLANDLGNLLHRSLSMCEKYFGGVVPPHASSKCQSPLRSATENLYFKTSPLLERLAFSEALSEIWSVINLANKFIEEKAPWKLSKEGKGGELKEVIVSLLEVLRVLAQAVWPFMPSTASSMWQQLGIQKPITDNAVSFWNYFEEGAEPVAKGAPLFPRIEKKEPKAGSF